MKTAYDLHEMHNRIFVFVNFFPNCTAPTLACSVHRLVT